MNWKDLGEVTTAGIYTTRGGDDVNVTQGKITAYAEYVQATGIRNPTLELERSSAAQDKTKLYRIRRFLR